MSNLPSNFLYICIIVVGFLWSFLVSLALVLYFGPLLGIVDANGVIDFVDWSRYYADAVYYGFSSTEPISIYKVLILTDQLPSAVAAFLFNTLSTQSIISINVLNSVLFAYSMALLFRILEHSFGKIISFFGCFVIMLLPSLSLAYVQINKEIFSLLAYFMIVYCFMPTEKTFTLELFIKLAHGIIGGVLLWGVRPYIAAPFLASMCFISIFVFFIYYIKSNNRSSGFALASKAVLIVALAVILSFTDSRPSILPVGDYHQVDIVQAEVVQSDQTVGSSSDFFVFQKYAETLSDIRRSLISGREDARTNRDTEVSFVDIVDIIYYTPKALFNATFGANQINFFEITDSGTSNLAAIIYSVETLLVYFIFVVFLFFWFANNFKFPEGLKYEYISIIFICILMMFLLFGFVFANMGTLVRMRLPFFVLLLAIKLCLSLLLFSRIRKNEV